MEHPPAGFFSIPRCPYLLICRGVGCQRVDLDAVALARGEDAGIAARPVILAPVTRPGT
jgi:hypothetical protein